MKWFTDFWRWLGTIGPGQVAETNRRPGLFGMEDDFDEGEYYNSNRLLVRKVVSERMIAQSSGPPPLVDTESYRDRQERLLFMEQRHELERRRDNEFCTDRVQRRGRRKQSKGNVGRNGSGSS